MNGITCDPVTCVSHANNIVSLNLQTLFNMVKSGLFDLAMMMSTTPIDWAYFFMKVTLTWIWLVYYYFFQSGVALSPSSFYSKKDKQLPITLLLISSPHNRSYHHEHAGRNWSEIQLRKFWYCINNLLCSNQSTFLLTVEFPISFFNCVDLTTSP